MNIKAMIAALEAEADTLADRWVPDESGVSHWTSGSDQQSANVLRAIANALRRYDGETFISDIKR